MKRIKQRESGGPRPVDIHVGRRLHDRRILMGLSQEQLGESVGVTFQQIQKYERGANRVSASRLWEFSRIMGVPVSWFFDEFDGHGNSQDRPPIKREALQLVRYFSACPRDIQEQLLSLFSEIAKGGGTKK